MSDLDLLMNALVATKTAETCSLDVAKLLQSRNLPEAITKATKGIKVLEETMANHPAWSPDLGPYLFQLYASRAVAYGANSSNSQALQDIERALAMPAAYHDAQRDTLLRQMKMQVEGQAKEKEKCFIATAAYGSALAPEVVALSRFRDKRLNQSRVGQFLIRLYERLSPPLADWIALHPTVRLYMQRLILTPMLWFTRRWMS